MEERRRSRRGELMEGVMEPWEGTEEIERERLGAGHPLSRIAFVQKEATSD